MTSFIAIALTGLSLAAAPAAESHAANPAAGIDRQAAQFSPTRRYCFKYDVTGSIIPQKTCKTYGEWMKQGVDPTAKP